jgi:transposase-like protein
MEANLASLPLEPPAAGYQVLWFTEYGCVVDHGDRCEVFVGERLLGEFGKHDRDLGPRNVLMVALSKDPKVHLGQLAAAFGLTDEQLRRMRRAEEREGVRGLLRTRTQPVATTKATPQKRSRLWKWFDEGATAAEACRRQGRGGRLSIATVQRERKRWEAATAAARPPAPTEIAAAPVAPAQLSLPVNTVETAAEVAAAPAGDEGEPGPIEHLRAVPVQDASLVQHLGSWLMLALAADHGLHEAATQAAGKRGGTDSLRVVLDAVLVALALGQKCVEGVRRVATPTAPQLLRASQAPTASWSRRVLHRFADEAGGERLHAAVSERYLAEAIADQGQLAVFYVDNHLRPYRGKHVLRRGWRMQDKRVLPGASDYWVHDEDGRPLFRVPAPSHDSLTQWLRPIAARLREALGEGVRILLAFDRAGAYPTELAALRDAGFEWVTYERRPYPMLTPATFDRQVDIDGDLVAIHEDRLRNLGGGRGRVRRIAVQTEDERQVNVLAVSAEPAERVLQILWKRWNQENAFKHGVERWGINQLDGRGLDRYPPDAIVPNPARRRLDHSLRVLRVEEGLLRNELARLGADHDRRPRVESDLENTVRQRVRLELLRPFLPKRAPLAETELADVLVKHKLEYKAVLDTLRVVCANVESELAAELAPHLARPAEAKKTLANLFAAPGAVDVRRDHILVTLQPAGSRRERVAFAWLLAAVTRRRLTLPGDRRERPLRFQLDLNDPV